jgi:hypothetical protein
VEAKPYSIQPPEQIAKVYGGDKQKIMQAAQMGIVDPTAALLAGMFIDRMRAPQGVEQTNPPTVAQQVLGGAGSAPPPQAQAPAGGLGAMPPAAGMAPPMPPQAPAPEQPPVGMADGGMVPPNQVGNNNPSMTPPYQMGAPGIGAPAPAPAPTPYTAAGTQAPYASAGLDGLPIPDTMFDENRNGGFDDGYAGGGLVAFADGGPIGPELEAAALKAIPGIGVTSRQRSAAHNAQVGGVKNSYHLTNNARDFVPPKGMGMDALHASLSNLFGGKYDILNEGDHVHVEPGGSQHREPMKKHDIYTPEGLHRSREDYEREASDLWGQLPTMGTDKLKEYYQRELSPEEQKKSRKEDMWAALTQIGASMASTSSPNFLQAVGQALSDTLPSVQASKKERKAAEHDAVRALTDIFGMERSDAKDMHKYALELQKTGIGLEESAADRKSRADIAAADNAARLAQIKEQGKISRDVANIGAEVKMDKGVEGLAQRYYTMGKNEAIAKGRPVDEASLRAISLQKAYAYISAHSKTPQQVNPLADLLKQTGVQPGAQQQGGQTPENPYAGFSATEVGN